MNILNFESNEALVFGINPMHKSDEHMKRKVRVDMKRVKFSVLRRVHYGEKIHFVRAKDI